MPIRSVTSDAHALTLTVVGEYQVPVERLWDAWADPRQLEKFWGPEGWPATFTRHDMAVGGRSEYHMTGPDGARAHGWWRYLAVQPGRSFEVEDGFADDEGRPNDQLPTMRMVISLDAVSSGSRFTGITYFPSVEAMERLVEMGMVEGMKSALGQLDATLEDLTSFAADRAAEAQILSDTRIRVSRVIRGTVDQVWRAHHDTELMKRWMLGPDGWTMPVCQPATNVGEAYRYEWEAEDGSGRFGFEGEVLESEAPHREVTTERMIGMEGEGAVNEMTLTEVEGGTLLTLVINYPSIEVRDMVLETGMVSGMEMSYARLEQELPANGASIRQTEGSLSA